jgi:hypothetical protein
LVVHFWDSSGLAKRYIVETGSVWAASLFQPGLHDHVIAAITPVEILAGITRRGRGGTLAPADAAAACALFRTDLHTDYQIMKLNNTWIALAMDLAESSGLRGYDAIQPAGVLHLNDLCIQSGLPPISLISADRELITVALREGLNTDDPNALP